MGASTEALKENIEQTRNDLGETLDAIEDRVSPGRVIARRKNRLVERIESLRHRAMGTAHETADQMGAVPDVARRQTEGAPLMAGALAFGVGFLVARAVATTEVERSHGEAIAERVEPLKEEVAEAGREAGHHLADSAKESAEAVKDVAATGAGRVADEARQEGDPSR